MSVHTSIPLTKTPRNRGEATKFHNRVEDAKTGKLLMDIGSSDQE